MTDVPMRRGFLYRVAVMDWLSRRVLVWRLSDTMETDFCIAALQEAMARVGRQAIFNTDQGSRFTSPRFTQVLAEAGIRISMDGRGRWLGNVFVERLWRSLRCECISLNAFETGSEARAGVGRWITYDNGSRPRTALRRANTVRGPCGLCQHRNGGVTETRTKLGQAANMSAKWGPPHTRHGAHRVGARHVRWKPGCEMLSR